MILGRSVELWQNLVKTLAAGVVVVGVFINPNITLDTLTQLVGIVVGVAYAILGLIANKAITGSALGRR